MPKYTTTVTFKREFTINAANAEEANEILENEVSDLEFDDLRAESFPTFEEEPVTCPDCKGDGEINEATCKRCNGDGSIPFNEVKP